MSYVSALIPLFTGGIIQQFTPIYKSENPIQVSNFSSPLGHLKGPEIGRIHYDRISDEDLERCEPEGLVAVCAGL